MIAAIIGIVRAPANVAAWGLEQTAAVLRVIGGSGGGAPGVAEVVGTGAGVPAAAAPDGPDPQVRPQPKDLDDVTIARKVESEIFRGPDRPKDSVDVNVVDGVVWLRGVAQTPELINQLESETRAIPEVREVQNLLHLPNTPAPTRTDTPAAQRRTRRKSEAPARPRRQPRSVNADKTTAQGETLPEDLAAQGKGRQPAPMGSEDPASTEATDSQATGGGPGTVGENAGQPPMGN